jgi:hypothetical protein
MARIFIGGYFFARRRRCQTLAAQEFGGTVRAGRGDSLCYDSASFRAPPPPFSIVAAGAGRTQKKPKLFRRQKR